MAAARFGFCKGCQFGLQRGQPNAVRVRIWRALKALGCAALRDGAYLLPESQRALFEPLAAEVREHGGTATVLRLAPHDDAQRDELLALFDLEAWRDELVESYSHGMRQKLIIASAFVSLDGVIQGPGGSNEDTTGGFAEGGWVFKMWDEGIDEVLGDVVVRDAAMTTRTAPKTRPV